MCEFFSKSIDFRLDVFIYTMKTESCSLHCHAVNCQLFMSTTDLETQLHNTVKCNLLPPRLQKKWRDSSTIQVLTPRIGGEKKNQIFTVSRI